MSIDINVLYLQVISGEITLKDFIDAITKRIDSNKVNEHLRAFLQGTQQLEEFFSLENQLVSPLSYLDEYPEIQYFVGKNPNSGHYYLTISVPAGHPFYGRSFDEVPNATYSYRDLEYPDRWLFILDYSYNLLTLADICTCYAEHDPNALLDKRIIDKEIIQTDIMQNIVFLAQQA